MPPPRDRARTRSECGTADSVRPDSEDNRSEENLVHKPFSMPTRRSIREGENQVVPDRFNPVDVQRKFRGKVLRLARLEIPPAVAVLPYAGDPPPSDLPVL